VSYWRIIASLNCITPNGFDLSTQRRELPNLKLVMNTSGRRTPVLMRYHLSQTPCYEKALKFMLNKIYFIALHYSTYINSSLHHTYYPRVACARVRARARLKI
jgi:hypothetical protein